MQIDKLKKLYSKDVFKCRKCKIGNISILNPYLGKNKKHSIIEKTNFHLNRRNFLLEYVETRSSKVPIMIIGEAPGLDGCGFCGIAFTDENKAINVLGLKNYHKRMCPFVTEESATLIYSIMQEVADRKNIAVQRILEKVYLTNSCMCVPLRSDKGTSVKKPSSQMSKKCKVILQKQIEYVEPKVIIVLGKSAFHAVLSFYNSNTNQSITEWVREGRSIDIDGLRIIPEIHPSKQNANNKWTHDLYPGIPDRLVKHISMHIGVF